MITNSFSFKFSNWLFNTTQRCLPISVSINGSSICKLQALWHTLPIKLKMMFYMSSASLFFRFIINYLLLLLLCIHVYGCKCAKAHELRSARRMCCGQITTFRSQFSSGVQRLKLGHWVCIPTTFIGGAMSPTSILGFTTSLVEPLDLPERLRVSMTHGAEHAALLNSQEWMVAL